MNRLLLIVLALVVFGCTKSSDVTGGHTNVKTGSLASFNIQGDFLILIDQNRIISYNITNPDVPKFASQYVDHSNIFETLFIRGDEIFVGSRNEMLIMHMDAVGSFEMIGRASHLRSCDPVVVQEDIAYVTTNSAGPCGGADLLLIYDVSDIFQPQILVQREMSAPLGLAIHGKYLYICDQKDGLVIYNVESTYDPKVARKISIDGARDIIIYDPTEMMLLTDDALQFYDITEPSNPVFKYEYE